MVGFSFIWPNFFWSKALGAKVNKSNGKDLSINRNDDDDDDHDDQDDVGGGVGDCDDEEVDVDDVDDDKFS